MLNGEKESYCKVRGEDSARVSKGTIRVHRHQCGIYADVRKRAGDWRCAPRP